MTRIYGLLPTLTLGLLLTSCGVNHDLGRFQSRVADGLERACGSGSSCTIKLADYTEFSWDSMYVFPYSTSAERITQVLGQPLPDWKEFQTHEVFVLAGKIVHREDFNADVERPIRREVVFAALSGADFAKITPKEELTVTVKAVGADVYYLAHRHGAWVEH